MKLKEIQYSISRNFIQLEFRCKDGSLLKEKFIGYKLPEAKKLFKAKYNNI